MVYLLLALGFVLLVKGADLFVDGSSSVARLLKVPSVIIGLTIVAMGTSAPEASVSLTASLAGNNDIAISNVVGSNIFNTLVVVGACGAIAAFTVNKDILKRDLPVNIIVSVLLAFMVIDGKLSRVEGAVLLVGMVAYIVAMIHSALKNRVQSDEVKAMSAGKSVVYILIGLAMIICGGNLVVDNASIIAERFGLSQNLIGLTIVAIGTSLPELVTSIVATFKGDSGLALGNAIGSNIFNILFILGFSSLITPMNVSFESIVDAVILIGVAIGMYVLTLSKKKFTRWEGMFCILVYVIYTAYIIIR